MNIIDVGLNFGAMNMNNHPAMIIDHHLEAEGSTWTVQAIHKMHQTEPQFMFAGIGYHYYIRLDGRVYKGRPDGAIGSHCKGANTNSLGVAFEGNYDVRTEMPEAQFKAWCELKDYLCNKYGNMPVYGHRDNPNTPGSSECPGANFPLDRVKAASYSQETKLGWNENDNGWWYCTDTSNDYYYKDDWKMIDGEWYLFDSDGYAEHDMWVKFKDKWYYLRSNCMMAKNQWLWIDGECYYFYLDGSMACDTVTPDGYKVDNSGAWVQ